MNILALRSNIMLPIYLTFLALAAAAPPKLPDDVEVPITRGNITNETSHPDFDRAMCDIFHNYVDEETRKVTPAGIALLNEALKLCPPMESVEATPVLTIDVVEYDIPNEVMTEELWQMWEDLEGESGDDVGIVEKYGLEKYRYVRKDGEDEREYL